jgi:2-amino-4-hydroxy-6-hydroxymethyldihydropteridine diphosphokinase
MSSPATAYIALGSNLGDRREYLDRALDLLRRRPDLTVEKVSRYIETTPVGGPAGQGDFLNAVATIRTSLAPHELLRILLETENALGRVRSERFGPRTLDLDLLLYGELVVDDATLTLPHPRMHERPFVLEPLAEIAPEAVHPLLGETAAVLRNRLQRLAKPAESGTPAVEVPPSAGSPGPGRELSGQRAVVTGSTSGIGRAIALELAAAGADVIVHGRRCRPAADAVAQGAIQRGVRAHAVMADVANPDQRALLVDAAWAEGPIDVWVNNAGADTLTGEAAQWSFERKLDALWQVDVRGTIFLSREVGRRMKAAGRGVIINIGWDQAETGMEGDSGQLFAAAKAAIMAFTKSLARSLAPEVRVNCLAPGWIRTSWGESASTVWQERVLRETPLARWGRPEDVAAACRWLASPAASYVTGQVIRVNGGAVL